jgi:RNA-splicing ligase RtcB
VESPVVFLPDFHSKPLLETPSSSVVLTKDRFSFSLTSPSQNCGMSFIKTPLFTNNLPSYFLKNFLHNIKELTPLEHRSSYISSEEVLLALKEGAKWAVRKFGLSEDMTAFIENQGNMFGDARLLSEVESAVPRASIDKARTRFCTIGGGNHFLEVLTVEEIYEPSICKLWDLHLGQVVIMFHAGSDVLGAYLGRLYAHRKKTTFRQQLKFMRKKVSFHFTRGPFRSFGKRFLYYLVPRPYRFIDPLTSEGKRALVALNSAANFAFANRIAIFNAIQTALRRVLNDNTLDMQLLYDCSHNSIYKENINGDELWAHRHNACRVYPPSLLQHHPVFSITGQPVILPGTNQTSSFLCAGREGAKATHFTVDHGLGFAQKNYEQNADSQEVKHYTYLFTYGQKHPQKIPLFPDTAINKPLEILNKIDIITTAARLKPLATLKGPKPRII